MRPRLHCRPPSGRLSRDRITRDPDVIAAVLEDAAHYPDGQADAVAIPRTEADVADILRSSRTVLPIGAQSSLTGGATPRGELVIRTDAMRTVLHVGSDRVRVQCGVSLSDLEAALRGHGRTYPPVPTFPGAFAGGIVATNAAGPATFKYGTTRDWVTALTVVLADGSVLDLERGAVRAADGELELVTADGRITVLPIPGYRVPAVPKRSAGYAAAPDLDAIDLFIGSEGTLGIVTEITFRTLQSPPARCLALVPCRGEREALDLVSRLRDAALTTWAEADPAGIDICAIEQMDRRSVALLREDGADVRFSTPLPPWTDTLLLVHLELDPGTTTAAAFEQIASALESTGDGPLRRFCRMLDAFGVLDETHVAPPGDLHRADQLLGLREAVPAAVNRRVGLAKAAVDARITKTAADMIVPFDRFGEMLERYRRRLEDRGLDYAIWGHSSDGNVHPNVIPRSYGDVQAGREAILEWGRDVAELNGCPLAEHGVGRNPVKQQLLQQLYGEDGIRQMRRLKRALDPEWKLAPGVIFSEV